MLLTESNTISFLFSKRKIKRNLICKQQINKYTVIIPCRSWRPCGFRRPSEADWLLKSRFRIPLTECIFVCYVCCLCYRQRPLRRNEHNSRIPYQEGISRVWSIKINNGAARSTVGLLRPNILPKIWPYFSRLYDDSSFATSWRTSFTSPVS